MTSIKELATRDEEKGKSRDVWELNLKGLETLKDFGVWCEGETGINNDFQDSGLGNKEICLNYYHNLCNKNTSMNRR